MAGISCFSSLDTHLWRENSFDFRKFANLEGRTTRSPGIKFKVENRMSKICLMKSFSQILVTIMF